jgi:hypothetical protein
MLTLHVRPQSLRREELPTTSTARHAPATPATQSHARAIIDATIRILASYPRLSEADIAGGYPLVITINPRHIMH